jgi:hypothetical protein
MYMKGAAVSFVSGSKLYAANVSDAAAVTTRELGYIEDRGGQHSIPLIASG